MNTKKSITSGDDGKGKILNAAPEKTNRATMLYNILLDEYLELGIFDSSEVSRIIALRSKLDKKFNILDFDDTADLSPEEKRQQFEMRQKRRCVLLKKVRKNLHKSSAREFDRIFNGYKKLFSGENFDRANTMTAAKLATLNELKGKKIKSKKDLISIYDEAVVLNYRNNHGESELDEIERDLEKTKRREVSNSLTALCLSGGGIRSATFALGILQSLAKHDLLNKFHYLSTVSGGGYIGSWLSAWICREGAIEKVQQKLRAENLPQGQVEAPEITYLRNFSNYMSPRVGMFSTDTWTLISVYFRNLLLNWTVFIPVIFALLLLPKLLLSTFNILAAHPLFGFGEWQFDWLNLPRIVLGAASFPGVFAICCLNMMRPSLLKYSPFDQTFHFDDIGVAKSFKTIFVCCFAPVAMFALGIAVFWFLKPGGEDNALHYIGFGAILFLFGYLLGWIVMLKKFIQVNKNKKPPTVNCCEEGETRLFFRFWNRFKLIVKIYVSESLFSVVSGGIGGGLLYLAHHWISEYIPSFIRSFSGMNEFYVCFGVPLAIVALLAASSIFTGLAVRITFDDDREWMGRFGALLLKTAVGWSVISSAVIYGPKLFDLDGYTVYKQMAAVVTVISGLFSVISGFSGKTSAKDDGAKKGWTAYLLTLATSVAAPVFLIFLMLVISYITTVLTDNAPLSSKFNQLLWFILLAFIGIVMSLFININKFSFHSIYRERLIRAYLGASNKKRLKTANSFTGFNTELDNPEMKDLRRKKLFHVINMTLNLVKVGNLAWQNRKAESFTVSALHSGSSNMGGSGNYRSSECYGYNKQNKKAVTLGTAAAISGAAVSPNMGYFSLGTAVSFLMVLLNVRLGWWLGNPGRRGNESWNTSAPKYSLKTLFAEALGQTDDNHKYVYLADGGQFENLGLYEMIVRRCKTIVVCDGGADSGFHFFDLGSAIHKIRVDMGIPIVFEKDQSPRLGQNCAIAKIKYSEAENTDGRAAEDGILIYIKPTLDDDQPIDIVQYKSRNPDFPHETTLDQFYSETQFESYRKLGFNMMESISAGQNMQSIADLASGARRYLRSQKK